ncbi:MAG: DUF2127 domain-containing protein [Rhodanobacter sp.]|uniref:DUF2127 domain-containing protein n=1 Tax=Rhodanobacter sp. PCA2 TaxID=2006117 RepID=UPI000A56ED19|nr:DUF2127 domain-containing protein [Rhodanobacter sp. PCA2]MBA2077746.1 hypothetical protein [Rhodanobacter sp. PCA2]MBN8922224.1 DUF2127 domain-containing protein [Rhodanobacter sp.]
MSEIESIAAAPLAAPAAAPSPHRAGLRVIAIYEVVKTLCLLLVAIAAFQLDRQQNFELMVHWLEHLPLTGSNELRWHLVGWLQAFGPSRFVAVGMVALGYAVLFGIEGVGLLMGKYWAEWFTVIATASLIPIELYETLHRFGWLKFAALVGNVAIVVYLVRVALQTRATRKAAAHAPPR